MAETVKTIRVIPFSGKKKDWNCWSKTFLATITTKGYCKLIMPTDAKEEADKDDDIMVHNELILSCQEDVSFGIVDGSVSEDFPDGDARLAWNNLQTRYEPNTGAAKVQLKQEFYLMKLESADQDPWLTVLELKRRRQKTLGATMEDNDVIIHILNNLPREYETVVELCEEDLSKGNISLATVKERIRARFSRLQKASNNMDKAVALMMKIQFKGSCNACGKTGHKGSDCITLEKIKDKKDVHYKNLETETDGTTTTTERATTSEEDGRNKTTTITQKRQENVMWQ